MARGFILCLLFFFPFFSFSQRYTVVPYPNNLKPLEGAFEFSGALKVSSAPKFAGAVDASAKMCADSKTGLLFQKADEGAHLCILEDPGLGGEEYKLEVLPKSLKLWASSGNGAFYGLQTLRQLVKRENDGRFTIPACLVEDYPAFPWRGFMIDVARNFLGKEFIFKTIDQLALLKFNVLHLHLTDHQGWRIEIKRYPKLVEVGSKWCPYVKNGYFTQDDIREIVEYAKARNMTVVPEIEILSHATAAVKAYPFLGDGFGVSVGKPEVREFFRNVIDEVTGLFPSGIIHLAGDEVDYKIWGADPSVRSYMKEHNLGTLLDAHVFYMDEMGRYLEGKARRMMAWDESFGKGVEEVKKGMKTSRAEISKNMIMHFWTGNVSGMVAAAKKGHQIVNADCRYTYFNYYYSKDEGSYLPPDGDKIVDGPTKGYDSYLRMAPISLRKAYDFNPVPADLDEDSASNILGSSCQLWFKPIDTVERFYDRAFPRTAAHAEAVWSVERDYGRFLENLKVLEDLWQRQSINYNKEAIK